MTAVRWREPAEAEPVPVPVGEHPSVAEARAWLTSSRDGHLLEERARLVVALQRICPSFLALSAVCGYVWGGAVEPWEPTHESGEALVLQARAYLGLGEGGHGG